MLKLGVRMKNNLMKYVTVLVLFVVVLFGCGGSGSDSENHNSALVLGEGYNEKSGDRFITSLAMNAVYSDGQTAEINSVSEYIFSSTTEIPEKYGYSNAISGPYLLETKNEDGILDGLDYKTPSGNSIIDDGLDYYTSIEYTTENGSEDPENIYIGDNYSFSQNSTLFNSISGDEAGYEITNMELSVLSEEQITVPAGEFNAVKIGFSISETTSRNNIIDTLTGTGYGWYDTTNVFMLKMAFDGDMTLNEHGVTASFSAETILQNYYLSAKKGSGKAVKTLSNKSIFFSLKKGILNFQKRI